LGHPGLQPGAAGEADMEKPEQGGDVRSEKPEEGGDVTTLKTNIQPLSVKIV